MAVKAARPPQSVRPLYERDFHAWCQEQADLLRASRLPGLDAENVAEELESMGRSERRALVSSWRVLLIHLLKWQFQPERRTRSWAFTIRRERKAIIRQERESPSLAADAQALIAEAYDAARDEAAEETGLSLDRFPHVPPWPQADLRHPGFFPGPATTGLLADVVAELARPEE